MKTQKLNLVHVCKQIEDLLIPQAPLDLVERAVYYHLFRYSHLEGKPQLRFSITWLASTAGLSEYNARRAVRSLIAKGVLHLHERAHSGHLVDVRLPAEIRTIAAAEPMPATADLESLDFLEKPALREAIHQRDGGHCFYCSRLLNSGTRGIDHVIPQVHGGGNSYRNLVSCCTECNSLKKDHAADAFLRWLFRQGRIDSAELTVRLRALEALAAGNLRPTLQSAPKN